MQLQSQVLDSTNLALDLPGLVRYTRDMIVAGTGHRPEDCEPESWVRTKARVKLQYPTKQNQQVTTFITGMAAGFDLWAADEARKLGIEVIAAVPWKTHKASIPKEFHELYDEILEYATKVHYLSDSTTFPGKYIYHKRNEWMVDNADAVMAYWNGKESGGTYACVKYADGKKPIANTYYDPPF